jgi:glycosyltransferase involved in cell wall biosynthesis
MASPLVSVIMPAYNQAHYLAKAIDSVLAQTFTDFELIVINDGSTDDTATVMAGYGDKIRPIHQQNKGLSGARNSGLAIARGSYMAFLDSDDIWDPVMLATTVTFMQSNPAYDLVATSWIQIDETGHITAPAKSYGAIRPSVEKNFLTTIVAGNFVLPSALLVKRACFEKSGLFDEELKGVEDWDLLIRMAVQGCQLALIDAPLLHYRRHSGCKSRDIHEGEHTTRQVLHKLFDDPDKYPTAQHLKHHAHVYAWLSLANYAAEANRDGDVQRLLAMAREHYLLAPPDDALSLEYMGRLGSLPHSEAFMALIAETAPNTYPLYLWLMARNAVQQKQPGRGLPYLAKLLTTRPGWLVNKFMARLRRDLRRPGQPVASQQG